MNTAVHCVKTIGAMPVMNPVIGPTEKCALSVSRKEEISMTNKYREDGIQRHQTEEAQRKLEQRRYERDHFSDGAPVAMYEGLQPEELWQG